MPVAALISTARMSRPSRPEIEPLNVLRGIAIVLMIVNHVGVRLVDDQLQLHSWLAPLIFLGSFAPVLLFFVTGFGVGAGRGRTDATAMMSTAWKALLLLLADQMMWWRAGVSAGLDFLGFIALSSVLVTMLAAARRPERWCAVVIGTALVLRFGIGPLTTHWAGLDAFTTWLLGNVSVPNVSYPFAPWITYPLAGYILGSSYAGSRNSSLPFRRWLLFAVSVAAFIVAGIMAYRHAVFFRWGTVSAGFYVLSIGVLLATLLVVCGPLARLKGITSLLSLRGISSLAVVPMHYCFIELAATFMSKASSPDRGLILMTCIVVSSIASSRWFASTVKTNAAVVSRVDVMTGLVALSVLCVIAMRVAPSSPTSFVAFVLGQLAIAVIMDLRPSNYFRGQVQPKLPVCSDQPNVLIVSEHASAQFGGEAALPLHYYRVLRRRGFRVWLVTHARTRDELVRLFPDDKNIRYVEDTRLHRLMWRLGRKMPNQISYLTTGFISRVAAQLEQRRIVKRLIAEHDIDVVHQPMPVSPKEPSMMYGFGVPVIIGPMNGGMDYPPSFRQHRGAVERLLLSLGRKFSSVLNRLMPGKRKASLLLVANPRTRDALPSGVCTRMIELVENGVDLTLWTESASAEQRAQGDSLVTFVFLGRLVDWKAVDLLLHAFSREVRKIPMRLLVIGDGDQRPRLEALANELDILAVKDESADGVVFKGWMSQLACARELRAADCLMLPSLLECGGAVVLEAMSMGKPVIATAWGGPADYLDESCGVLVPPTDRESLIEGLAAAMHRLASSPSLRLQMGNNGRAKVIRQYDWEKKVDRVIELYKEACEGV